MKSIIIYLCLLFFITSCTNEKNKIEHPKIQFYRKTNFKHRETDKTLFEIDIPGKHRAKDSLIDTRIFELDSIPHTIYLYTNMYRGIADGVGCDYELDSLGIIFSQSLLGTHYSRLQSNNDSINNIINTALEYMILWTDFKVHPHFKPPKN